MSLTIVLSGPKTAESQARTALAAAGYNMHATSHDHGLPDTATGKKIRQAVSFITVDGEDVDGPPAAVASLGYVLRMHHDTPEPSGPTVEERLVQELAEMRARIDALENAG